MSLRLKILLGTGAVLLAALVLFDWNWFRKPIENYLAQESRRGVSIGHFDVTPGLHPTIRFRQLRVENAPWADTTKPLIVAAEASFTFSLRSLWDERTVISLIVLRDAEVDLQKQADGLRNWRLVDPDYLGPPKLKVLSVDAERSTLRIANRGFDLDLRLAATEAVAAGAAGAGKGDARFHNRIDFSGLYKGVKFSGSTLASRRLTLRETGETFPLLGHMLWNGNRFDADGVIADLLDPSVMDGKVRIAGPSLASLPPFVRFNLPATRPYRFDAQVSQKGNETTSASARGKIGSTDLAGEGSYTRSTEGKPRPFLRAAVRSAAADLDDFGADKDRARAGERLFSTKKFDAARLGSHDAQVSFEAGKLKVSNALVLDQLRLTLAAEAGLLQLKPVTFGLAGGRAAGSLTVDAREGQPTSRLAADFHEVRLERLFPQLAATARGAAPIDAQLRLAGDGDSFAALFGSASGKFDLTMGPGRISNLADAKLALNGGKILMLKLRGDQDIAILCGAAGIDFSKGSGHVRALTLDTEQTRVDGSGSVDLRAEKFSLLLVPQAKKTEWFPLGTAIKVEGSFKHVDFAILKSTPADKPMRAARCG